MKIIKAFVAMVLIFQSMPALGQELKEPGVLETDSTWRKEVFNFPLSFAPEIKYRGTEDVRFPAGWEKKDSNSFWSYVFVWNIDLRFTLTAKQLEADLQLYFDGLMKVVNGREDETLPSTRVSLVNKDEDKSLAEFTGTVSIFDAFFTKQTKTLNLRAEQHFCAQKNKVLILFRFSPKEFENDIWKKLDKVKLRADACHL